MIMWGLFQEFKDGSTYGSSELGNLEQFPL